MGNDACINIASWLLPRSSSPAVLFVCSPNRFRSCTGDYELVEGWQPNGEPLWRQTCGDHYLFSGSAKKWIISIQKNNGIRFQRRRWLHTTKHATRGSNAR